MLRISTSAPPFAHSHFYILCFVHFSHMSSTTLALQHSLSNTNLRSLLREHRFRRKLFIFKTFLAPRPWSSIFPASNIGFWKAESPQPSLSAQYSDMSATSSAAAQAAAAKLISAIEANLIVNYTAIGCCALVVVDYLQTLPDEIKYMWPTDWSVVKVLFLLVRYYPFVHTSISTWHHGTGSLTGSHCFVPFIMDAYSCLIITMFCEAISYIRLWAFSGRNKYLLAFLVPYYAGIRAVEWYFLVKFVRTLDFLTVPKGVNVGCIATKAQSRLLSACFMGVLVSLTSVTLMMIVIAYRRRQMAAGSTGSLFRLFYRDGIFYFICLSSLSIANIICDYSAPQNGMQFIMVQVMIHTQGLIAGRMLIDLRAHSDRGISTTINNPYLPRHGQSTSNKSQTEVEFAPYDSMAVPKVFVRVRTETAMNDY